jgi:3-dehydroquinate dehydratase
MGGEYGAKFEKDLASLSNSKEWLEANEKVKVACIKLILELRKLVDLLYKDLESNEDPASKDTKINVYLAIVNSVHTLVESFIPPTCIEIVRRHSSMVRDLCKISFGEKGRTPSPEEIKHWLQAMEDQEVYPYY